MEPKSVKHYTATYVPISSGYLGQLLDWPEVVTEGKTIEECRELLVDALHEMILVYLQLQKPIPEPKRITEQAPDETEMHTQLQFQSETVFVNLWSNNLSPAEFGELNQLLDQKRRSRLREIAEKARRKAARTTPEEAERILRDAIAEVRAENATDRRP